MTLIARVLIALLLLGGVTAPILIPFPAHAQNDQDPAIDYDAWAATATRAEDAIAAARASDAAFDSLRAEIVGWRDRFAAGRNAGQSRIDTVRGQIDALGPAPAEGASENDDIAARRKQLNDQLAQLEAPRVAATEAWSRADGIVSEIDTILRERSTSQLLETRPAPFNPANWPDAATGVQQAVTHLGTALSDSVQTAQNYQSLREKGPGMLLLVALAVLMMARGPALIHRWTQKLRASGKHRAQRLAGQLLSLGEVILPILGLGLVSFALETSGLLPRRVETGGAGQPLSALPLIAIPIFVAGWLGRASFPGTSDATVPMLPERQSEARAHLWVLGIMSMLEALRAGYLGGAGQSGTALLVFLIQIGAAISLFRLGRLLRRWAARQLEPGVEETRGGVFRQIVTLIGTALIFVAIAGPLLAGAGWVGLGSALTWSTVATLAVIAILALLQRFFVDGWLLATGRESGDDALMPVVISMVLMIAGIPLLALIWGARVTDISDLWDRVRTGISLGGVTLNPTVLLTLALVFGFGILLTRLAQGALRSTILPRTKLDKGGQNAVISGLGYIGITLASLAAVSAAGISLSSLAFIAGALSLGIGFGMQNIVQNFVSGIILLIERPVGEGDWIEAGGRQGIVKAISVRSTRIETFDKTEVIVPNADLISGQVVNWTRGNLMGRVIVPVGVAFDSDTRLVEKVLLEVAMNHPLITVSPPPRAFFIGFGQDALMFEIRAMVSDVNFGLSVKSDLFHDITRRFREEGIAIPFIDRAPAAPAPLFSPLLAVPEFQKPVHSAPLPRPAPVKDEAPPESGGDEDADGDGMPDRG